MKERFLDGKLSWEMNDNKSKPAPRPIPPSNSPGTPFNKAPVPPSRKPGSSLPFGEPVIKTIK